ncbi:MAG TPA: hypothetical protein VFA66_02415 [Gaiellaceae bacterium]|nr:hypothetical protein [Gaiellaceae bacterium]
MLAASGVSYATVKVTGAATNIVDPSSAANIAKVDNAGRLLVGDAGGPMTVDGTVGARSVAPANPLNVTGLFGVGGPQTLAGPSAAVNITALLVTAYPPVPAASEDSLTIAGWDVPGSATDCNTSPSVPVVVWSVDVFAVQPEVGTSFPTPLTLRPPAGRKECLVMSIAGFNGNGFLLHVNVSGFSG